MEMRYTKMEKTLSQLKAGESGTVKALEGGHGFQRRLHSLGIRTGKNIRKVSSHPFGGPMVVKVDGMRIAIGRGMTHKIIVSVK